MGVLLALCIVAAVLGLLLIILSVIPGTGGYVPNGLPAGVTLLIVGVVLYLVLSLVVPAA